MKQLNIEIDDDLYKRVKLACIEDETNLKTWVTAALEKELNAGLKAMSKLNWRKEK